MALEAYCITWTVSIPDTSSKNHPQLVYMSWAPRCMPRSFKARIFSSLESSFFACSPKKRSTFSGDLSFMTSMYSFLAAQGSLRYWDASCSNMGAKASRRLSRAALKGALHCWFHAG